MLLQFLICFIFILLNKVNAQDIDLITYQYSLQPAPVYPRNTFRVLEECLMSEYNGCGGKFTDIRNCNGNVYGNIVEQLGVSDDYYNKDFCLDLSTTHNTWRVATLRVKKNLQCNVLDYDFNELKGKFDDLNEKFPIKKYEDVRIEEEKSVSDYPNLHCQNNYKWNSDLKKYVGDKNTYAQDYFSDEENTENLDKENFLEYKKTTMTMNILHDRITNQIKRKIEVFDRVLS